MVTMIEVARAAGVSQSTVSHVINKTRRIAPETERAVLDAIERTGYVSDAVARSLRTGRSGTIALAISTISNPYFADVVHAIERTITEAGFRLVLIDAHDDPDQEVQAVRELISHRPDGLIIAPSARPDRAFGILNRKGVPTVLVDRIIGGVSSIDSVTVESTESMRSLVGHVASKGHRRIAFITPKSGLSTTTERLAGYRLGLEDADLPYDSRLVLSFEGRASEVALREVLASARPTALVAGNNQQTIETLRGLDALGMKVPGDISLACFDDFPWADLFEPRLTAIRQPVDLLGGSAARMLLERIENPDAPARHLSLAPELIIRSSVAERWAV